MGGAAVAGSPWRRSVAQRRLERSAAQSESPSRRATLRSTRPAIPMHSRPGRFSSRRIRSTFELAVGPRAVTPRLEGAMWGLSYSFFMFVCLLLNPADFLAPACDPRHIQIKTYAVMSGLPEYVRSKRKGMIQCQQLRTALPLRLA